MFMLDGDFIQLEQGIIGNNFLSDLNNYKDIQFRTFPSSAWPEKVNSEMEQFYPSFRTHC